MKVNRCRWRLWRPSKSMATVCLSQGILSFVLCAYSTMSNVANIPSNENYTPVDCRESVWDNAVVFWQCQRSQKLLTGNEDPDCCIYQTMCVSEIRIVKNIIMLQNPKWNTLHDMKQLLFTMIWIIWPADLLQKDGMLSKLLQMIQIIWNGRPVAKGDNSFWHYLQMIQIIWNGKPVAKAKDCFDIFCKWFGSSGCEGLLQRERFVMSLFARY